MATPKKYFHDHTVLALLSANVFLALAGIIFILVRLTTSHGTGYIVQFRPSLGINAYQAGTVTDILSMTLFLALVLVAHTALSLRIYKISRHLAVTVLALGILLLLLTIIISNALLLLR